jgi:hypothetical protein
MDRVSSNVVVNVVDLSDLFSTVLQKKRLSDPSASDVTLANGEKIGYVTTPKGIFVLSDEGVGSRDPITGANKLKLEFCFTRKISGASAMGIIPEMSVELDEASILEKMSVKETVPLHDFVRRFGARLECNYELWRKAVE